MNANEALAPPRHRWRFTLQGLFVAITGIATVFWLFTWAADADERVIVTCWLAGVITILLAPRGRWMLRVGWLMATLLPTVGFWLCHAVMGLFWRYGYGPVMNHMLAVLATIVGATCLATAILIVVYNLVARLDGKWRTMATAAILMAGFLMFVGGRLSQRMRSSWRPILTINEIDVSRTGRPPYLSYAISDDGKLLAVGEKWVPNGGQMEGWVRLWDIETGNEVTPPGLNPPSAESLCFSPDGKLLAVLHRGISVYVTSTGRLIKHLNIATGHTWESRPCRFSPDGRLLVLCTADPSSQRVTIWKTTDWTVYKESSLDKPARPVLTPDGISLLAGITSQEVELLDLESLKAQFAPRLLVGPGRPVLSPSGKQVGCGYHLVDLPTGKSQYLAAPAYCFVNGGQWLATRRCDTTEFHQVSGSWGFRGALPFVRHRYKHAGGELMLLDVTTGEEICASPAYQNEAIVEIQSSAEGKHIVAVNHRDQIRVWQVPESE